MKGRGPKFCPPEMVGTDQQTIWIRRGGNGRVSGAGPSGHKLKPAKVLARSLAEMARGIRARGSMVKK